MPFIDRFDRWPTDAVLMAIEGAKIIDLVGPGSIQGVNTSYVAVVGQALKEATRVTAGATSNVNVPTVISTAQEFLDAFGGWSPYSNPGGVLPTPATDPSPLTGTGYDGNLFMALAGKTFARLVLVNAKQDVGTCTITATGTAADITIPAGIRVTTAAGTDIFATIEDIHFVATDFVVGVATMTGVKIRRVLGAGAAPIADNVLVPERTGAVTGYSLGCTLLSAITDIIESAMEGYYIAALNTLLNDAQPANLVSIVAAARHRDNIVTAAGGLKAHALAASAKGQGRVACVAPPLGTAKATAKWTVAPGVGNYGLQNNVLYAYPGVRLFIPEVPASTIGASSDGDFDWPSDVSLAALLSQINPEENPGARTSILAYVKGIESGVTGLVRADYEDFRSGSSGTSGGIIAPRIDAVTGCEFQSGITSVNPALFSNQRNVAWRRMSYFIQDSIASRLGAFTKTLNTVSRRRGIRMEVETFLDELLSPNNTEAQRIAAYSVDEVSGNTAAKLAQGIFVLIIKVQLLSTMDFIVIQAQIGETVEVAVAA